MTMSMPMMPITGEIYIRVGVHWLRGDVRPWVLRPEICEIFTVPATHSKRDALPLICGMRSTFLALWS